MFIASQTYIDLYSILAHLPTRTHTHTRTLIIVDAYIYSCSWISPWYFVGFSARMIRCGFVLKYYRMPPNPFFFIIIVPYETGNLVSPIFRDIPNTTWGMKLVIFPYISHDLPLSILSLFYPCSIPVLSPFYLHKPSSSQGEGLPSRARCGEGIE